MIEENDFYYLLNIIFIIYMYIHFKNKTKENDFYYILNIIFIIYIYIYFKNNTEENDCYYICSVGFRKSCNMYSLINNDNIDHYNFNNLKENDVLYIKTDALYNFSKIINNINCKFILVSGCSDYTIPNDRFYNLDDFKNFIKNDKIIHMFFQNCIYKHPKITNLPIGLDYHTLNSNINLYWGKNCKPIIQEYELINIKNNSKPFYDRICKCYSTFHFSYKGYKYENDRIDALNNISSNLIYFEPNIVERKKTWEHQINYSYVISPHGNGLDCHRTWEALVLGCIPIVKKSNIDALYDDLPVLIVNNWYDLNEDLLNETIQTFKKMKFNYDKLSLIYWINKFNEKKI